MPPKRKNNVPTGAAKGRRPRVAGTRGRTVEPGKPATEKSVPATEKTVPATEKTVPATEKSVPATEKSVPATEKPESATPVESPASEAPEVAESSKTETAAAPEAKPTPSDEGEKADTKVEESADSDSKRETAAAPPKARVANRMPRMGARPQSEAASVSGDGPAPTSGDSRVTWRLVSILGIIALVLGIFAVVAAFKPFARFDNTAWIDGPTTAEVSAAAKEASEATFSYGFETVDEDFDRARTYMNDEMRKEFDQTADTTKTAVQQTKTATQAEVSDVGVSILDGDRATLVAFMNVSSTNEGAAQGSTSGSLVIDMERIDGKWVLAGIRDA
ncbi:hypothetical protein [Rhodococcus sp. NPDC058521]|uniref:hypothetical protein n=1 Tax=Rhodococcus sp. NPDC058521 TaxID=3346536 RepID=UPI00365A3FE6